MREAQRFDRKDSVAALCAILAAAAIITNALYLQRGPHPAPILVKKAAMSPAKPAAPVATAPMPAPVHAESRDAVVLPRSRPVELAAAKPETTATATVKSDLASPPRPVRVIALPEANAPRPPDPIGEMIVPPARRVSAVQRVLSDFGYGQIKATGTVDRDTQDAIEQFERARKLPVTRQITPVLMRELTVMAGRPLD